MLRIVRPTDNLVDLGRAGKRYLVHAIGGCHHERMCGAESAEHLGQRATGRRGRPGDRPLNDCPELSHRLLDLLEATCAIRGGQLRRSDVMELRDIFSRVGEGGGTELRQLRDRIVKAINDQKLTIEDPLYILYTARH